MYQKINELLQKRAELFMLGRYRQMTSAYEYPLPVYLEGEMVVVRNADEMVTILAEIHRLLTERGVTRVIADVKAVELPRSGRMRIWTEWEEFGEDDQESRSSEVVYFGRMTENGYVTEAVQYSRLSMPEMRNLAKVAA